MSLENKQQSKIHLIFLIAFIFTALILKRNLVIYLNALVWQEKFKFKLKFFIPFSCLFLYKDIFYDTNDQVIKDSKT